MNQEAPSMPPIYEATELKYGTSYLRLWSSINKKMELYRKFIELHKSIV